MNAAEFRPLPRWGWVLAVLFFPCGLFVAFGYARLLPWSKAAVGALLSYGCVVGGVRLMVHGETAGASPLLRSLTPLGGVLVFSLWGWVLYAVGQRAGFWSPVARSAWSKARWFALALLALAAAGVALQFATRSPAAGS